MPITFADVKALLDTELARITQPDLVARISELLVPMRYEHRICCVGKRAGVAAAG